MLVSGGCEWDRTTEPLSCQDSALPLSYAPESVSSDTDNGRRRASHLISSHEAFIVMGCRVGFEPTMTGFTVRGLRPLGNRHKTDGGDSEIRTHGTPCGILQLSRLVP